MSAPAKVITNGLSPTLTDWNFMTSVTGPDEVTFTAHDCPALTTYQKGDQVPGYTNMRIHDIRARLIPGSLYDLTCSARGLISGTSRVIARRISDDTLGWDVLTERRMETASSSAPVFGATHPNHSSMFFMQGGQEETLDLGTGDSQWVLRDRTYRGIANGVLKKLGRRVTVNENIVTQDSITVNLPGGWTTARKGKVSFPRIVVEDTILTTTPPPTSSIPGNATPPNAPTVQTFNLSGTLTYNWPSGWKLASINSEELFLGAGVYHQTLSYEYVWPAEF